MYFVNANGCQWDLFLNTDRLLNKHLWNGRMAVINWNWWRRKSMRIETKRFVIGDLERNDSFIGIVGMRVEDTLKISSYRRW